MAFIDTGMKYFHNINYRKRTLSQRIRMFGIELITLFSKGKTGLNESNFHYCVSTDSSFWITHGVKYGTIAGHVAFANNEFSLKKEWEEDDTLPHEVGVEIINDILFEGEQDLEDWAEKNPKVWGSNVGRICLTSKVPYHFNTKNRSCTLKDIGIYFTEVSDRLHKQDKGIVLGDYIRWCCDKGS